MTALKALKVLALKFSDEYAQYHLLILGGVGSLEGKLDGFFKNQVAIYGDLLILLIDIGELSH